MSFRNAVKNTPVEARTENGMKAFKSSLSNTTDLFFKIGASRGKNITLSFETAYHEDRDLALRIAQWARDVRGGAGERELYRQVLKFLEKNYKDELLSTRMLQNTAEIGRFDDLLIFEDAEIKKLAFGQIKQALDAGNGLAAKWMPRKGPLAAELRAFFGWSPKFYRKRLVELTKVVETQMCAKEWDGINFSHVPSLAMSRYTKAFFKNTPEVFGAYMEALKSGDPKVKVNAGAVYPYDIVKSMKMGNDTMADEQWKALPNYMGSAKVMPMVDVSGSMDCPVAGASVTCMDVAISLGLYCSDKNTGPFKDLFLTFSERPEFVTVTGTLSQKYRQMSHADWGMSTNLHAGFNEILRVALENKVSPEDMPEALLILSDMQFNQCAKHDDSAMQMIQRKYEEAGYKVPAIVFWNLRDAGNTPVKFDKNGTALVSGFSPAIMKSVLAADFESMTPESIMRSTVMVDRYAL